jgi:hypothetical protein
LAKKEHNTTRKQRDAEIEARARNALGLSMRRAGRRCPPWARTADFQERFLYVYRLAAKKNYIQARWVPAQHREWFHVDHVAPLGGKDVCGLHVPWNLVAIPKTLNLAKQANIVQEWLTKDWSPRDAYLMLSPRARLKQNRRLRHSERVAKRQIQNDIQRLKAGLLIPQERVVAALNAVEERRQHRVKRKAIHKQRVSVAVKVIPKRDAWLNDPKLQRQRKKSN